MRISRRWLVASLVGLTAVGSAAAGIAVAAPFGQEGAEKPRDRVLERAAEILGVEPKALQDAFKQAHEDIAKEQRGEFLAKLVADGVITPAESEEIRSWLDNTPDAWEKVRPHIKKHHGPLPPFSPPGARMFRVPDDLLEKGLITTEQADRIRELMESLPKNELLPGPHIKPFGPWPFRDAPGALQEREFRFRYFFPGNPHNEPSAPAPGTTQPGA